MSQKGYYRYKLEGLTKGVTNVIFYVNALPFVTHKVLARETCTGWRQLKWLDQDGQYAPLVLNKYRLNISVQDTDSRLSSPATVAVKWSIGELPTFTILIRELDGVDQSTLRLNIELINTF